MMKGSILNMKIISVAAVAAGGKTTVVNELKKRLWNSQSLHFDNYTFEGEVENFYQWVLVNRTLIQLFLLTLRLIYL